MAKVFIMDHPLVQHKVTMLRDKNTSTKDFRELAGGLNYAGRPNTDR